MPPEPLEARTANLDAEALRQATLQASWARDRRVGRRRVVLRWLAWAFWRYGLALLLVLAAGALAVIWITTASRESLRAPRFMIVPPATPVVAPSPHPEPPSTRQEP